MVLFFFLMQKTAYEMRISDWISDVCSSDLEADAAADDISDDARGQAGGTFGVPSGVDDVRGHAHRRVAKRAEGFDVQVQLFVRRIHHRGLDMAVARRASMAGHVLDDADDPRGGHALQHGRSEEHTSELQSLMRISYAVFCLKTKHTTQILHILPMLWVTTYLKIN